MTMTMAVNGLPAGLARWAARRRLTPGALTGIGAACGGCAAAWFTAGTTAGTLAGGAALAAGCLVHGTARRVRQLAPAPAVIGAAHGWLAAGCALAAELAVYAGLAAGAPASQQRGIWALATAALILLAFRQMAALCQDRPAGGRPGQGNSSGLLPTAARLAGWLLALPPPARAALICVSALAWGPRVTFTSLLAAGTVAAVADVARHLTAPAAAGLPGCRGDGPIARRAGWLARGQLSPLPPAIAGLAATAMLAVVGLRGLSGVVVLAPVAVMLLAAPGAGHPHDGRLDWLVPPALQAGQYIYLTALGFASGVAGPLTFALVCVVALRHQDAAYRARHQLGSRPRFAGAGFGWEGRMLAAGAAALLGVATFAYLVLTAYLGVLLGWIWLSSWYSVQEGVRG